MSTSISTIDAMSVEYPEPNDAGALRCLTFVRVRDSDGVEGWGEAITMLPGAARATEDLVDGLKSLLIGRDPLDNEALWNEMREDAWWYGHRGGIFSFALSAIDIALWDLKGKLLGITLATMLGGARRETLPVIASTHAFDADLRKEAERHAAYVRERGFKGFKIGMGKRGDARLGYDVKRDVDFVAQLRELSGPDAWIMMDRGKKIVWTPDDAIARVRGMEEHGLKWIEEPFEPDDTRELQLLRDKVDTLIAGGEREWDLAGYTRLLSDGLIDVVGADVGRAGGVTGIRQVIGLVENKRCWFNAHAWSSAINTAASLALSASTDRVLVQELKPDTNPMQDELVDQPIRAVDGMVGVPSGAGLGVTPQLSVIEFYRLGK